MVLLAGTGTGVCVEWAAVVMAAEVGLGVARRVQAQGLGVWEAGALLAEVAQEEEEKAEAAAHHGGGTPNTTSSCLMCLCCGHGRGRELF